MDRFIHEENLRHYRRMLERTLEPEERARILNLLAEEEAKTEAAPEFQPGRTAGPVSR